MPDLTIILALWLSAAAVVCVVACAFFRAAGRADGEGAGDGHADATRTTERGNHA